MSEQAMLLDGCRLRTKEDILGDGFDRFSFVAHLPPIFTGFGDIGEKPIEVVLAH